MTWSWSHASEAYDNARDNVAKQSREWLEIVFAEWHGHKEGQTELNERKYNRALSKAKKLTLDVLADYVWERMEAQADCTNGGFEAHACPFGCACHMVPFDATNDSGELLSEPQEDDYQTSDYLAWCQYGKRVLTLEDNESWPDAIKAHMDANGFFPNCWFIGERGEANLLDLATGTYAGGK